MPVRKDRLFSWFWRRLNLRLFAKQKWSQGRAVNEVKESAKHFLERVNGGGFSR
ncbi:MAG: hypothetical protein H6797_00680 [Candidatus Nomurabacteria bacterium]|nr:MAG: hypothetical protein H6797_00680 [Candidatus Nomurabacteria bacterium]